MEIIMRYQLDSKIISDISKLDLFEVIISQDDKICDLKLKESNKVNVHSISKLVTALCIGIAIEQGYFEDGVNEPIFKFFSEVKIDNSKNLEYLKYAKIKHLLTLTLGHDKRLLDSKQIMELKGTDLVDFILNYPIVYKPGEYFIYTSAPVYLASVLITKVTGKTLLNFARQNLFSKLSIDDVDWLESEQGYSLGCTGLKIRASDLHKIGLLLLNNGNYEQSSIVSKEWITSMKTIQKYSPAYYDESRVLPKYGYGYNLWICKNGIYFCDGTDGQYVIVVPNKKMVVTTTGNQKDMGPITEGLKPILL